MSRTKTARRLPHANKYLEMQYKLCHFHAFRAVDMRLKKTSLEVSYKKEIYESFESAVYAKTERDLAIEEEFLETLGIESVNFKCQISMRF